MLLLAALMCKISFEACTTVQASFPKIVGGIQGHTQLLQIDYSPASGYLVGVGKTNDLGVKGGVEASQYNPIIVAYLPDEFSYGWGKIFIGLAVLDLHFSGVSINRLGTELVVANYQKTRYVIVMDIVTGVVKSATLLSANQNYSSFRRNLLLLDSGSIIMGDQTQFLKIQPQPAITARNFSLSGYVHVGIHTNSEQSHLHLFAFSSTTIIQCLVTVLDLLTFTNVFQYQVQCDSPSITIIGQNFQACTYESDPTIETIVFQKGTNFYRIINQYTIATFAGSTLHDPSNPALQASGLYCLSNDLSYSLMSGTYLGDTDRIFIAEINFFSSKITYSRYLQLTAGQSTIQHGVIYGYDKFFIPSFFAGNLLYTAASAFFNVGINEHGVIYSPILTCQQIDLYQYPEVSAIRDGFSISPSGILYIPSLAFITDETTALPTPVDVVSIKFEGQYSLSCSIQIASMPNEYKFIDSTQQTNVLYYSTEAISQTFTITPFNSTKAMLTAPEPVYIYSLQSFSGPANAIGVNSINGVITLEVPAISYLEPKEYSIVIEGLLQDCQSVKAIFTLKMNTAPKFQYILEYELSPVSIQIGSLIDYNLPNVIDPEFGQMQIISMYDSSGIAYPGFLDFTNPAHNTIRIQPISLDQAGAFMIQIRISDGISITNYTLNVVVETAPEPAPSIYTITNSGPPQFTQPVDQIILEIGYNYNFKLPPIQDPDGDQIVATAILGESSIFTDFNDFSLVLNFSPQISSVTKSNFTMVMILADLNKNPLKSKYLIEIVIQGKIAQIPNTSNPTQISKRDIQNPLAKIYKCNIKITEVNRKGMLYLKIAQSNNVASQIIAKSLNESDIDVRIISQEEVQIVKIKIAEILDKNILAIQLQISDLELISAGVVRFFINNYYQGYGLNQSENIKQYRLKY
ncbi:hypothetical protein FGO68_gene5058 [Halteria grandinella]|uniref:Uncharacterized protein n=1 Tax=Halteria grandinella TaxID=5974 RepID=A0A8J8P3I1_HALGN|nr:hypothetical protein FGO68_gene5058 [Halteria grandinella]